MEHKVGYVVIIVLTLLVFTGTVFINALSSGAFGETALFHNSTGEVSEVFFLEITPAGWTFSIWGLIYTWQALWIIYGCSTMCRSTSYGYLYISPAHIPPIVYIIFMFNNVLNVSWLVMWDRFYPQYALVFIILTAISLYAILYLSCFQLHASAAILKREFRNVDVWLTRILLHNGIGLYASWVTIATLLNVAVVITYQGGLAQTLASTIALSLLMTISMAYFFIEVTTLDQYLRYVLTPYVPLILGLIGSLVKNWDLTKNNSVLSAFTLATIVLLFCIRLALMAIRHKRSPQYATEINFYQSQGDYGSMATSYEKTSLLS